MYDVLGLVLVVANLEKQNEDGDSSFDETSLYSTIHSIVTKETKLPLKDAFNMYRPTLNKSLQSDSKMSESKKGPPIKYKPVNTAVPFKKKPQRQGSTIDAFLDDQTRKEFVIIGQEGDPQVKSDPITARMVTEDMEVSDLEDAEDDIFEVITRYLRWMKYLFLILIN